MSDVVGEHETNPLECVPHPNASYDLESERLQVATEYPIDETWAGHAVGQSLLTHGEDQYVAYYDADRVMTVAHRRLGSDAWQRVSLDSTLEWDSHNYVVMAVDAGGRLHVSGNMHVDPLVYFREAVPGDVSTLERIPTLINAAVERRVTYPAFLTAPDGAMVFTFRDGSSGDGVNYFYRYDHEGGVWHPLLAGPLFDGEGQRNAYAEEPKLGPDGFFHVSWVWRDTPDAATNSRLSYMRSRDLLHWETRAGAAIVLPVTYEQAGVVIEDVPVHGGLLNGLHKIGFDAEGRPVVAYHRYEDGGSQLFVARGSGDGWQIEQVTAWRGRWQFGGGGSLARGIRLGHTVLLADGRMRLDYEYRGASGSIVLDSESLLPYAEVPVPARYPSEVDGPPRSAYPEISVRLAEDRGQARDGRYVLRWETLSPNRDQPRSEWPTPQPLTLYRLSS
ncbi:BNR repeat-containing protein [Microbacterium sp. LTA6]|uniref:BNR repeat-containing protein n=1 Tax=unclassified Microbacterium TaxID=2609290 RepID=UPI003138DBAE